MVIQLVPESHRPFNSLPLLVVGLIGLFSIACGESNDIGEPRLINGPMIGVVTPSQVTIWGRVMGDFTFSVLYDTDPDMRSPTRSEVVLARAERDFSVQVTLRGLQPATTYYYRVMVDGHPPKYLAQKLPFRAKTAPAPDDKTRFVVSFGSCPRVQEEMIQPIWYQIREADPDLFFWLGDNIYGDTVDPQFLAEIYRRQRDVASLQPVLRNISNLAIWDDHDYALNDGDRENPIREESLRVFKNYWANPAYGLPDVPGVFFRYQYGGVDFFFLDCRYYRDPSLMPDGPNKTFLGERQLNWLMDGLRQSRAPFKVLVNGSGWTSLKGPRGDSWASALHERDRLFDFLRDKEVPGVLLISGDTHQGEWNCIPWSEHGGYDLYEFVSSPLAQGTSGKVQRRIPEIYMRDWYGDAPNFGYMIFDLTEQDPLVRYNLIDVFGDADAEWIEIRASELVNGVTSWPDKIDAEEREKREKGLYLEFEP